MTNLVKSKKKVRNYYYDFVYKFYKKHHSYSFEVYNARAKAVKKWAWAIPNSEALKTIAKYSPIIEMGAGSGYWKYLLENNFDVDIIAYDKKPYENNFVNNKWTEVLVGEPEVLKDYSDRALFLCWTPYESEIDYESLMNWNGKYLIYVGEGYGGCTGSDKFHKVLDIEFELIEDIDIPQWSGLHDRLMIYQRK